MRDVLAEVDAADHAGRQFRDGGKIPDVSLPHQSSGITVPTHPKQLHTYWSNLSPEARDELYRADPFLGNRNGIPQIDRDHYNRRTLTMLEDRAEREFDIDAMDHYSEIARALDAPSGSPRRYLSLLDDQFRTAIAVGNPDTAKYVVTLPMVAGRKTDGVPFLVEYGGNLCDGARSVAPDGETSAIAWIGYKPPEGVIASIDSRYAREGAPLLRDYQEGLRATHEGTASLNTVVGYSYGAVTAGHAAMQPLYADQVAFMGSFGTGVERATDLRLVGVDPADIDRHVFSTVAEHDSILLMPSTHGPAPTSPDFGGTSFHTDSTRGVAAKGDTDPWGSQGWNPDNHMSYFDRGTQSLRNLAMIVTGNWPPKP
ncbi:alpha/beta hydrolase [Nocardia sp. NPDC004750]